MIVRVAWLSAVVLFAVAAAACGGDDDGNAAETRTSAAEQAEQTPGKAVRCGQRSFRVAFDPEGAVVVAAADDTLASVTQTQQTVSGRCTLTREEGPFDQGQLRDRSSDVVTISCNVREPPDIVVRGTERPTERKA